MKIFLFLSILVLRIKSSFAWFENCDESYYLDFGDTMIIQSPNYPYGTYPADSSCRHTICAPEGAVIVADITINIPMASSTQCKDYFYVAREHNPELTGSTYYCGQRTTSVTSLFNCMNLAYISTGGRGKFYVELSLSCDCGWSKNKQIVGGTEAGVNEFTAMAGMVYSPHKTVFCAGAIIAPKWVLSVAHCFQGIYGVASDIGVLVGDHDISSGSETSYSALYTVASIKTHDSYSTSNQNNDIALVKTKNVISYNRGVAPACLPWNYATSSFENIKVDVAGWGTTEFGGPTSNKLLKVTLDTITNTNCINKGASYVTTSKLCTFTPGKDACQFDSGGPLWIFLGNRLFSVGLVSYGNDCASDKPGVNTRITSFLNWILNNTPGATYCQM